jgi:hypothetical protein
MVSGTTGVIKGLLTIERSEYEHVAPPGVSGAGDPVAGLKTAWGVMRIISTVLIVGIALFMILAQIFNFSGVSAYTVKKVMPRLVIAVILIQLSWFLATNFVAVINVIGRGLEELLYAPFGGEAEAGSLSHIMGIFKNPDNFSGPDAAKVELVGAGLIFGSIIFIAAGGIFGLLAAAIAIIIAIVMALAILTLRKALLAFLIVLAPLALVMWILPNTQKTWQKWWENFTKLLLMFPLIVGFLAIGKIFAYISASTGQGSIITYFVIIVSYFGPFFMIPKTFKMSGTMMSAAAGGVKAFGDRSKKGIMESKPMANFKQSRDYNKKAKGLDRAAYGKNPVSRYMGRWQAGTVGRTGRYGRQSRSAELEEAQKNATSEIQSEFDQHGITDFGEQNKYLAAMARGDPSVRLKVYDAKSGTLIEKDVGLASTASKRISSATTLTDRGESDHLRTAWGSMDQGLRAAVNRSHGAKIAALANDLSGRASWKLGESQLETQDDETLRNYAAEYEDIQNRILTQTVGGTYNGEEYTQQDYDNDTAHEQSMMEASQRATAAGSGIKLSATQRQHLAWVAGGGTGNRPDANLDYAGNKPTIPVSPAAGGVGPPAPNPAHSGTHYKVDW